MHCFMSVWDMSFRKVSYKACKRLFCFFREIWEKLSLWPDCQSAPSCQASRPQISLHLDTTLWRFNLALIHHLIGNSNRCFWFVFTLGLHKWPDLDKCLKWATLIWNNGRSPGSSAAAFPSFRTASERPALCLFASLSQHPRNSDILTAKFALKDLGCLISMSCRPRMLLDSNTELQPIIIMHRKGKKIIDI